MACSWRWAASSACRSDTARLESALRFLQVRARELHAHANQGLFLVGGCRQEIPLLGFLQLARCRHGDAAYEERNDGDERDVQARRPSSGRLREPRFPAHRGRNLPLEMGTELRRNLMRFAWGIHRLPPSNCMTVSSSRRSRCRARRRRPSTARSDSPLTAAICATRRSSK